MVSNLLAGDLDKRLPKLDPTSRNDYWSQNLIVHVVVTAVAPDTEVRVAERHVVSGLHSVRQHVLIHKPATLNRVTGETDPVLRQVPAGATRVIGAKPRTWKRIHFCQMRTPG
jgi:hypothetical protein